MCGFAAFVGLNGSSVDTDIFGKMLRVLVHRGPDSEGMWASSCVALGFRRLSILDLSHTADQPMRTSGGRLLLIFDVEISDYLGAREGVGLTFTRESALRAK